MVPIGWSFLLDSHINSIINFHPSVRIPLGTCFLRGSWLSSLNHHKEFGIVAISLFHDEDIEQEVFEAFKVPPTWFTRFLLELHDIFPNESGLMNWIKFLQEDLDKIIPRCDRASR